MSHSLKSIRQQFRANGVFYSDPRMAELLRSFLPVDVKEVYDPTCGDGALLSVFGDDVRKFGQELDPEQADIARERLSNCVIVAGDTLTNPAFDAHKFKAIIANYPFSVKYDPTFINPYDPRFCSAPCWAPTSRADYMFLLHILHYLADDGVASVLNFPGVLYRGQREGRLREWLVRLNVIDRVELIEGGYFEDTKIATALLVLKKQRPTTDITFADHALNIEKLVSFKEIEANGFSLSVGQYVQPPEPEKPPVDPRMLENKARTAALKLIKSEIEFSKTVAAIEGWTIDDFLDDIERIVSEARMSFIPKF